MHPNEGHDIPSVRSIRQLEQTRFFKPDEYDGLVEIHDQAAYELCLRLNREESITAGPSSGMALAGTFQMIPDEPGNRIVVIFPDSAYKYASSMVKHLPELRVPRPASKGKRLLDEMIQNVRANVDLTIDAASAHDLWKEDDPVVIDVREFDEYRPRHVAGSINIPLHQLADRASELPDDRDAPLLIVCQRGNISLAGVLFLTSLGFQDARSVTGGTDAWHDLGYAVESSS